MRMWPKLLVLCAGLGLLGAGVVHLLRHRPFDAAPTLEHIAAREPPLPIRVSPVPESLQPSWPTHRAVTPPLTRTTNLLLAGIDTRPGGFSGGRTDALVLVVIDRRSRHVGLVGIPRDLVVDLPGHGTVRINTVYLRGTREGGPRQGVRLLGQTVRQLIGLAVDHTVFIDHAGFEGLVDALGGISVRVVCPIRDRFLDPRGPDGRVELRLEAGVHWMDGRTALMFSRSRHGRGVTDRARRQLAVLLGFRDRVTQLGPHRIAELLPQLRRTVYTELPAVELIRLLRLAAGVRREHLHGLVLGWRHVDTVTLEDGRRVMRPRPDAIHAALRQLFQAGPPGLRRPVTCPPMDAALTAPRR